MQPATETTISCRTVTFEVSAPIEMPGRLFDAYCKCRTRYTGGQSGSRNVAQVTLRDIGTETVVGAGKPEIALYLDDVLRRAKRHALIVRTHHP